MHSAPPTKVLTKSQPGLLLVFEPRQLCVHPLPEDFRLETYLPFKFLCLIQELQNSCIIVVGVKVIKDVTCVLKADPLVP